MAAGTYRRRLARGATALTAAALVALQSCAAGSHHPTDTDLQRNFRQHQLEFEALLADLRADPKVAMVTQNELHYVRLGTSRTAEPSEPARWDRIRRRLRTLGIVQANQGMSRIDLRVDQPSVWNGDSYKGYEYSPDAPPNPRTNIDTYRISLKDKDGAGYFVSRPIGGNWYIFLFVSG